MFMLEVRNLRKHFGNVKAVDDVNLGVRKGELVSIIGPNGAGKTTLINLISRWLLEDSGSIIFQGEDITHIKKSHDAVKKGIVRSFQLLNIFNDLTVFDNLCLALLSKHKKSFKIFSLLNRDAKIRDEATEIADKFNLSPYLDKPAKELPHGNKKLLDVAMAYALSPKLLLLDEPTSGVSTSDKQPIMEIIKSAVREMGITTIMVEHDMDIVFSHSDRVVVMFEGKVLLEGTPEEVYKSAEITKVIGG
ncbi:MAG: ABC transporter ATP-binding protein, partial [Candidatus Bathyarchaeia archaeon]